MLESGDERQKGRPSRQKKRQEPTEKEIESKKQTSLQERAQETERQ